MILPFSFHYLEPLADVDLYVGMTMVTSDFAQTYNLCAQFPGPVADGAMATISCNPAAKGQYVAITIPGQSKELTLCEVTIFTKYRKYRQTSNIKRVKYKT